MFVVTGWFLILLSFFLYWCYEIYRKNKMVQKIPGPTPIPFIGLRLPSDIYEVTDMFENLFQKYGDIVKLYIGESLQIFTCNAELMEDLMKSNVHLKKSNVYDLTHEWLLGGLIVSDGLKWKQRRKLITPSFHFSMLKDFFPVFKERTEMLVQKLGEQADKGATINVMSFISKFSLDVIAESSLGVKLHIQEGGEQEYINAVNDFTEILLTRSFSIWKRFYIPFILFAKESKRYRETVKFLNSKSKMIISQKRKIFENQSIENTNNVMNGELKKKFNLLDALMKHEELNDTDIHEEVNNFVFAGYDTTSTAISFILYELSKRPEIQEKLFNEIYDYVGDDIKNVTQETIQEIKYMDMVIKEVFRFRSPIPFIGRKLEEDAQLGSVVYPKGTTILMSIFSTHKNMKYFSDPEKFDPERFNPENPKKPPTFAYIPFSAGPRNCIGQKYASLEIKTVLTKLMLEFKFLPVDDDKMILGMSAILRPKHGYPIKLERRKLQKKHMIS